MNQTSVIILLCLNFICTSVLGTLFFVNQQNEREEASKREANEQADPNSVQNKLTEVVSEITNLNETVQRFSTSSVQYDFLKREMDQLAVIDQTIGAQAQATASTRTDKNTAEVDEALAKLGKLSQQVKGQLQGRRKTMLQLIAGLEKELAQLTGSLPQKIQPKPEIAVPTPTPTPTVPEAPE